MVSIGALNIIEPPFAVPSNDVRLVAPTEMPPVPEVIVRAPVVKVPVELTLPAPPGVAVSVIELAAVSAPVSVTLPAVELSEMLFAVILVPMAALLIVFAAVTFTRLAPPVPFTALLNVTPAPVEVRFTVFAVIVPPEFVKLPDELRETVPMVPAPAARLPARSRVPLPTVNAKVEPLPAAEACNVTAAAVSLAKLTLPVECAVSVDALIVLAPAKVIPAVPAVKLAVGAFNEPPAVIPLAAPLTTKVNEEPELALRVMPLFAVSATKTTPVELAASVVAFVPLIDMPPVPAEADSVVPSTLAVVVIPPTAPVAARVTPFVPVMTPVPTMLPEVAVIEVFPAVDVNAATGTVTVLSFVKVTVPMVPLTLRAPELDSRAVPVPFNEIVEATVLSGPLRVEFSMLPPTVVKLRVVALSVPPD